MMRGGGAEKSGMTEEERNKRAVRGREEGLCGKGSKEERKVGKMVQRKTKKVNLLLLFRDGINF